MFFALVLGLVAAAFTYWGVARFLLWAKRRKFLDLSNERWKNVAAIERNGCLPQELREYSCVHDF